MFSNVVISGGGLAGIAYLGCLKYLHEDEDIKKSIKNLLGVSSGSIFALILTLDLTYDETLVWLRNLCDVRINHITVHSLKILIQKFGLDEGHGIIHVVKSLYALRSVDESITFRQLAQKFGYNLIVAAANINTSDIEYFSIDTAPDMQVIKAIRASTAVPLLFVPVFHDEQYFVDAFIYDNFPFQYFKGEAHHTLGLNLISKQVMVNSCMDFFTKMFNSVIKNHSYKKHQNECIIECANNGFNIKKMGFEVDENFEDIVENAYTKVKEFVSLRRQTLQKDEK